MKRGRCWWALFTLVVACGDTLPRTQVMLVIDAEAGVRAQTSDVQIVIRGGTGAMAQWQERLDRTFVPSDNAEWPFSLALVPLGNDASRVYEATATAMSTSGDPVARVRAVSGYREGQTLELRLIFEDDCRDQVAVCSETQTCRAGACVDANVDATSLQPFKPGTGSDAGGTGGSGGSGGSGGDDASIDSGVDSAIVDAAITDSGVDAGDINECLSANVCTADYPCQNLPSGYTCRGQFPDWSVSSAPSFTDNGNGTVTDNRSTLVWQQAVDAGSYTWADAKTFCDGLTLAGMDWRLPTRAELLTLVDAARVSPAIDPVAFPSTPSEIFWSSSPRVGVADNAWWVQFSVGTTQFGGVDHATTHAFRVRCVRSSDAVFESGGTGGPPPGRYTYPASGTVYDTRTMLTWQQAVDPNAYAAGAAETYCATLSLAGTGWRLPTLYELESIIDDTRANPAIDPVAFPSTPSEDFMSSTQVPSFLWVVTFSAGDSTVTNATSRPYRVRCVR